MLDACRSWRDHSLLCGYGYFLSGIIKVLQGQQVRGSLVRLLRNLCSTLAKANGRTVRLALLKEKTRR